VLLQKIAEFFLFKCDGCLLAITIIGTILWENKAQTPEKWKDVYEKFKDYADVALAEDYKGPEKWKDVYEKFKDYADVALAEDYKGESSARGFPPKQ